jgi:SAM-dependent methyltransferase
MPRPRAYDKAYFDKYYRAADTRVRSAAEVERMVRFVLAATDYVLGRPARSVLDVGAGEGNWQPVLKRLRPTLHYQGVDPSAYAVRRFGRARNLLLGDLSSLGALPLRDGYDLVVANGVLNYLDPAELRAGLPRLVDRADGMLYLEIFTESDDVTGDTSFHHLKPAVWYRRLLRGAGLVGLGMHCYLPERLESRLAALERSL